MSFENNFSSTQDLVNLHIETDPTKAEQKKLDIGTRIFGALSNLSAIKESNQALFRYRKDIKYADEDSSPIIKWGVYESDSFNAIRSLYKRI